MFDSSEFISLISQYQKNQQPYVLATVVRCELPTSGKPGQKALLDASGELHGWIGGGCAQPAVIEYGLAALKSGIPQLLRIAPKPSVTCEDGITEVVMSCHSGGTLDIFLEPVLPREQLLIVGGSECARHLATLATTLEYEVTLAWPEATAGQFPSASQILASFDPIKNMSPDVLVVSTQGKRDEEALEAALSSNAGYIAFVASRKKWERLRSYLIERGFSEEDLLRIKAPAGLDIGGVTPSEIALSVVAELVTVRNRDVQPVKQASVCGCDSDKNTFDISDEAEPSLDKIDYAIDPVCGMKVKIEGAEHTLEKAGELIYFCCAGCKHEFAKQLAQPLVNIQVPS